MTWRVAKSLLTLIEQVDHHWPDRSRAADGTIGDTAHASRVSDHNPNSAGVVTAWDCTEDSKRGANMHNLAEALRASHDPRIKYVIWDHRMFSSYEYGDVRPFTWRPYTGIDPHTGHLHLSVSGEAGLYDDARKWRVFGDDTKPPRRGWPHRWRGEPFTEGAKGRRVAYVKRRIHALYPNVKLDLDNDGFGAHLLDAVKRFQRAHGLDADGWVGKRTWKALNT